MDSKKEIFEKIQTLATECHQVACAFDVGDDRTEMFEVYGILLNLGRRGYAAQVSRAMNPLLNSPDDDYADDEEWWDDEDE